MRAIFLAHGSPEFSFSHNTYTQFWEELGRALPVPKKILVISAHWLSYDTRVTGAGELATIHDYNGFPSEFYDYTYNARGSEELISSLHDLLSDIEVDQERGLDHGAWCLLKHLFPKADIPVAQLSINMTLSVEEHMEQAKKLLPLLAQDTLVIGSGNVIHNLSRINRTLDEPYCWAHEFERELILALEQRDYERQINLPLDRSVGGNLAVPSMDHYIPLLYSVVLHGLNQQELEIRFKEPIYGSLSMLSII
jgi:4,5-DOPA dioxygenase extradiol